MDLESRRFVGGNIAMNELVDALKRAKEVGSSYSSELADEMCKQLKDCEQIARRESATLDPELVNRVVTLLHVTVTETTPATLTPCGKKATPQNFKVLQGLWKLLNTLYNQMSMKSLPSSWYDEELECLLMPIEKYADVDPLSVVGDHGYCPLLKSNPQIISVQAALKMALQQIHNCLLRVKDFSTIDQDKVISTLNHFLKKPKTNPILRISAMVVLSLIFTKVGTNALLPITMKDAEYLKCAFTDGDFTTLQLLNLLKTLSALKENISVLNRVEILDSISDIFNNGDNTQEQEVAASLIEIFFSDEGGKCSVNNEKMVFHTSTGQKAPHIEEAKTMKLKMNSDTLADPLTFQVSSLEELVFLTGYDIAVCVGEAEEVGSPVTSEQRSLRICLGLRSLLETIAQTVSVAVHRIMSVPYCLDTICIFMRQHWHHIHGSAGCSLPFCNEIADLAGILVTALSDESQLAQGTVVQWGLILRLAVDLSIFSKEPNFESKEMQSKIQHTLFIIHNCSAEAEKHYVFHRYAETINKCISPYSKAQNATISFSARTILLHLGAYLGESSRCNLILSNLEVKGLVNGLKQAVIAKDFKAEIFGRISSAYEILSWLAKSTICKSNVELMERYGITQAFHSLLKVTHSETSVSAAKLLWILAMHPPVKEKIKKVVETTDLLKKCSNSSLIFKLALHCIQSTEDLDQDELLMYAKGSYEYSMYEECIYICNQLDKMYSLKQMDKEVIVKLLLGKALFKVYRRELLLLENSYETYHARELREKESSCYDKVHKTIRHLLVAHKHNVIDAEGSTYLDIAMMDIIRGRNELNKVSHCMLCLKKEENLRRSHVVPKSILGVFRKGFVQHHGDKGLTVSGILSSKMSKYHSEKTITKYMLCGDCEMLLSLNGEEEFSNKFFGKLYDPLDPSCLKIRKALPYGSWMYHFCIGLLFRVVAGFTGVPYVANHKEICNFIKVCRSFLLHGTKSECTMPLVYLLTNPITIPTEYENKWVHEALVEPGFFQLKTIHLSSGAPCFYPEIHFLIAHIGMLNLIVKFLPAEDVKLPNETIVNPTGGVYIIPPDKERLQFLPEGVKEVFTDISEDIRKEMTEFLFRREKEFPPEVSKSGENYLLKDAVNLVSAIHADFDLLIEEKQMNLNTLPASFHVDHTVEMVSFPPNYKLLIHSTIGFEKSTITFFVGVKTCEVDDKCQPFVIFYQLSHTGMMCGGCFVSVDDYSVKEYIGGIPLHRNPQIFKGLTTVAETIPDILPVILKPKGFTSLRELVDNFQLSLKVVKTLDTKCLSEQCCWFCKDKCNCCMDIAAAGVFSFTSDRQKLLFCGTKCSESFIGPDIPLQVTATLFKPAIQDPILFQSDEYWKIFKIFAYARNSGRGVIFSLDLFQKLKSKPERDSSQCFAYYHLRQVFSQQFKALYINSEGIVYEPSQTHSSDAQVFTQSSPYYDVEKYFLEICKLLFKCHEKMVHCMEEKILLFLDCTEKSIVKMNQISDIQFENEIERAITTINSYRIVSQINNEWGMKVLVLVIQHLENLKEFFSGISTSDVHSHHCVENLINEAYILLAETISVGLLPNAEKQLQCTLIGTVWKLISCLQKIFPYLQQRSKNRQAELSVSIISFIRSLPDKKEEATHKEKAKEAVVFHILQQLTVLGNIDCCAVASALEPFLVSPGDRRWLSLIVLYSALSSLSEHQTCMVAFKEYDIPYFKRYFSNCPCLKDVLTFISHVLTLPTNKRLLLHHGVPDLIASVLCNSNTGEELQHLAAHLIEGFFEPISNQGHDKLVLSSSDDSQLNTITELCVKIKRMNVSGSSVVNVLQLDENLEEIYSKLKILEDTDIREASIEEKHDLVNFVYKAIFRLLSGLFTVDAEYSNHILVQMKTLWQFLMASFEDILNNYELTQLAGEILTSISRCSLKERPGKEVLLALCDVLNMLYQLVKIGSRMWKTNELVPKIVEVLTPILQLKESIVRLWALLILINELSESHVDLLSIESGDVTILVSSSAEQVFFEHVICFTDQLSFSAENCLKFSEGGLLEILGQLMENEENTVEEENIASLIERILKKGSCGKVPM